MSDTESGQGGGPAATNLTAKLNDAAARLRTTAGELLSGGVGGLPSLSC